MQKPLGLLSLLDEESTFPNGTDLTLANKLKEHLSDNSCFRGDRGKTFTVAHYAGEVIALGNSVAPFYKTRHNIIGLTMIPSQDQPLLVFF